MDNSNEEMNIEELQNKMQQELKELQEKYSQMTTQIQELQNNKSDLKNSIKTMNDSFEQVSKNVEHILAKLDNISGTNKDLDDEDLLDEDAPDKKIGFLVKKILFTPLRKLTVGTIASVLSIVDGTSKLTCEVKEGFEDIVAEAQYQRKRKQMAAMDEI
ncbi:hypothetical protein I6U48_21560 [Clostridium sp. PL3]|uniref:Uncharacterized protein n=1 Tax=Clostridium thailandense TaxID=2794346 RepID=A0A949X3Y4_9CLOT|nr:coiled-coil domain-containing protein 22 [Clostridium thailandense]MBV7275494.1 hypothetical protein [Clostridium thailandense]